MKKQTWWNRIFHHKQIKQERETYQKYKIMAGFYKEIYDDIVRAKGLKSLITNHKFMWKLGYRNENLGPCSYGMFRTENIENLNENNLYLGNIYGLCTHPAKFWEDMRDEPMGTNGFCVPSETKIYDLILDQYKKLLKSNLNSIKSQIDIFISEYERINSKKNPYDIIK